VSNVTVRWELACYDASLFRAGRFMKSSFANHLTLICALAVFAFAAFALHVNLKAAPQPVTEVTRAAK
jgi:hypothetical protein